MTKDYDGPSYADLPMEVCISNWLKEKIIEKFKICDSYFEVDRFGNVLIQKKKQKKIIAKN